LGRFSLQKLLSMNASLLLWSLLAASIFWGVGAYNRLTALRVRAAEAFGPLDKCLQTYVVLIETHGHEPAAAVPEWLRVKELALELVPLIKVALAIPVHAEAVRRLQEGHAQLQSAWKALNDTPADLAGGVIPEALKVQWDAATIKTQMAWEHMQDAVENLSEAASQFPASVLVGSMGLKAKHDK
jgi:hypothetical protein